MGDVEKLRYGQKRKQILRKSNKNLKFQEKMGGQRDKMGVIEHQIDKKNHFDVGGTPYLSLKKDIAPICLPKALNSILIYCLLSILWRYQSMFKKISKSCLQLRYQTRVLSLHPWPYFLPTPPKNKKKNKQTSLYLIL